jgi:hypothetical protein
MASSAARSRRAFLARDLPLLTLGSAAAACGLLESSAAERTARRYIELWAQNLESMRSPYTGAFDAGVIAVGEYRSSTYGGEFAALQQIVEAAKPDAVAFQGLEHNDSVIASWNEDKLFPFQMFNYFAFKTEGRQLIHPIKPPQRDKSLEGFFEYLKQNGIRFAGIEPTEAEVTDAVLALGRRLNDVDFKAATTKLRMDNIRALHRSGMRLVTFSEFILVGGIVNFLTPVLAAGGKWRTRPDDVRADPRLLYPADAASPRYILESPETYTIGGVFGKDALPVLAIEPGAVQEITERMALQYKAGSRPNALQAQLDDLRAKLAPFREPDAVIGDAEEYGIVCSVSGGVRDEPIAF